MEENNNALDSFLKILKEQEEKIVSNINQELYDDICKTAEILDKTENETEVKEIKNKLIDKFKNVDLNQVTDLFIYNQMFFTTNENPLPTPSILCINIGKLFEEENLHYTASKVYSNDEVEGGSALSFLGYLALHEHHKSYVLTFLKENFEGFSQNKKTELVFQLKNYLPDDTLAKEIVENSGITEYRLTFSTEEDSSSRPITFKFNNDKMDEKKLNKIIHSKLLKSSEIFLKKDYDKNYNIVEALDLIEEIKENNLNDVTDIYIYEEGFGATEKKHKETLVHLITSVIAFDYSDENISYLKESILKEDNKKSDISLDYFLKIGAYHEKFRDNVLDFVENNLNNFTKNKLNTIAFYMFKIYNKNTRTNNLFNLAKKLNDENFPSKSNTNENYKNVSEKKSDFEKKPLQEQKKQAWWQFWKK